MKPEIKTRLAQIQAGEIPKGYKKGKLGIVPEDWEEINFSDLFTSTSEYTDDLEKYPLYSLTIEDGITAKTERYDRSHLVKKENSYKIVRPNDFAYNPMNIRFGAVARHKGEIPVAVSGYYDIFTTVHPGDLTFMDNFLTCGAMITYYNRVSTGSLVEKQRVHFSDFLKFSLPLPPLAERERIAKILSTQDKVIECYEKKIDQLKRMKKYYLQNMFPKRGETVPKIRFKGFTDPWEQRKLASLCKKFTDGDWIESKDQSDSGVRLIQTGNVGVAEYLDKPNNKKWISMDTFDRLHCEEVLPGDILISRLPEPTGRACIMPFLGTKMITAVDCTIVRTAPDVSNKFLVQYLSSQIYFDVVNTCLAGGTRQRISRGNLGNFDVLIPTYKTEQDAVGTFFEDLDNLITLHQRKLEEEKKKKKALQQLLLTGIVRTN